jgi:hypothetical protein
MTTTTAPKDSVCDSCMDSSTEEMDIPLLTTEDIEEILSELGGVIGDHLCDELESDGEIRCGCGCHRKRKRELRSK